MAEAPLINNISKKLEDAIAERRTQLPNVISFRSLGSAKFHYKKEDGSIVILDKPTSTSLSGRSVITEPGSTKRIVIGVTVAFDTNRNEYSYAFKNIDGQSDDGILQLTQGVDDEWINYLLINPEVKGSLIEMQGVDKKVELVDVEKKSKEAGLRRNIKREAMNVAATMKDHEIRSFIASINRDDTLSMAMLRDEIETMAESSPELFTKLFNDTDRDVKSTLRRAITAGVVTVDSAGSGLTLAGTGQLLVALHMAEGLNVLDKFASFVNATGTKGQEVLKTIKVAMGKETAADKKEK